MNIPLIKKIKNKKLDYIEANILILIQEFKKNGKKLDLFYLIL